ncbi:glycerate kinase type-2 family protein [Oceanithermus sp.]
MSEGLQKQLQASLAFALERTSPRQAVQQAVKALPQPTAVLAVGKAAGPMLAGLEDAGLHLPGFGVTRYGHGRPLEHYELLEAGHPVPDEASVQAAERALELARALGPDGHLLVLISGGGSALWCAPWGLDLEVMKDLNRALLASGAGISEMNAVRKHLSRIKGGRLAQATRARVTALLVSDVPGDDVSTIASGPTAPDPTTFADALAVLERYQIDIPAARAHLELGAAGELLETPKPGDPLFSRVENEILLANSDLLRAAASFWEKEGWQVLTLSDRLQGEARELARFHAAVIDSTRARNLPRKPPFVLLSGGEATVAVRGNGRGGRNLTFLAWLAYFLGSDGVWALAADSDGIDGSSPAAGAILRPNTLARAAELRLDLRDFLARDDSHGFFEALGDLVITGPTGNNLNDLRVILVE